MRVLSTDQARSALQQMQQVVDSGLTEAFDRLDHQGRTLSDPEVWDGPLARHFRDDTWPRTHEALGRARNELGDLREQLARIADNIMAAGGAG